MSSGIISIIFFDKNTIEGGHGGPSFFLPVGESIYSNENTSHYAFLAGPDGPADALTNTSIIIRSIKKFTTLSGDIFYVSATTDFLEDGDPRVAEVLRPYVETSTMFGEEITSLKPVNSKEEHDLINTEIIKKIFPTEESFKGTAEFEKLEKVIDMVVSK